MSYPKIKEFFSFDSQREAVSEEDWKFGYGIEGTPKSRIIVTLKDHHGGVRHYDKDMGTVYYCVGCLQHRRMMNNAELVDGIFNAPTFHDCRRVSVDKNAEEQLAKETKFKNFCKELVPISTVKTFIKPRYQEFALPAPIIRYLIKNPNNHETYKKLIKTCKWFYFKNKLNLEQKFERTQITDGVVMIKEWPI